VRVPGRRRQGTPPPEKLWWWFWDDREAYETASGDIYSASCHAHEEEQGEEGGEGSCCLGLHGLQAVEARQYNISHPTAGSFT
jgi:hypothetical protein